ncbi:response regulator [uncultured Massilia sp.]|uniref:response regulator n=1 Tax=uncultured Massilia sp. TaxID=169973 RepID=UPI0025D9E4F0|nr:response regulator [uncultured Massilia sp.]
MADGKHFLLVEPEDLLRRTVAMTARSLNLGQIHEAAGSDVALRMLRVRAFHGAVIAVDCVGKGGERRYDLSLVDRVRAGDPPDGPPMPIAIMAAEASPALLDALRERRIRRVILKPFRARVLLDTIADFGAAPAPPRG